MKSAEGLVEEKKAESRMGRAVRLWRAYRERPVPVWEAMHPEFVEALEQLLDPNGWAMRQGVGRMGTDHYGA